MATHMWGMINLANQQMLVAVWLASRRQRHRAVGQSAPLAQHGWPICLGPQKGAILANEPRGASLRLPLTGTGPATRTMCDYTHPPLDFLEALVTEHRGHY